MAPGTQGGGGGTALVAHVERALTDLGPEHARTLIVETSSLESFAPARRFYRARGFAEEARIRQFYGPDDDEVVFWKALTSAR